MANDKDEQSPEQDNEDDAAEKQRLADLERQAVAEATASADESYVPSPSLLNAATALPLLKQVDGPALQTYEGKESIYAGRSVPVTLRGRLDVPIHVTAPGSVVEYAVETKNYDIGFAVTAEREEGTTIVKENSRVDAHTEPITGKFLVGAVPCMLVFSFDNEYSWMREKEVTYRITVTPPSVEMICAGRRRRAKACLKAVEEDLVSAQGRLERTSAQTVSLSNEYEQMAKSLAELKKSLEVAKTEEKWLETRVALREEQLQGLTERLDVGWEDEEQS